MPIKNAPEPPIQVSGSTLPATLSAALRYVLSLFGTWAVARGWVKPENIEGIVTVVLTLATIGYGLWKTSHKQQQLITAADAAPNSVAKVV